jgi:hypothetical protein
MTHYGYDGGDSQAELIKAANALIEADALDAIEKIRQRYWPLGSILEIAKARGYTKELGVKGWIATHLKTANGKPVSHTHAYGCMKAWQNRHDFDAALEWYKTSNTPWRPKRQTGPEFANDLVQAWRNRDKPESRPNQKKSDKEKAVAWRQRYQRLADEHRKWAEQTDREPLVLNQIEAEIAAEETPTNFPVIARAEDDIEEQESTENPTVAKLDGKAALPRKARAPRKQAEQSLFGTDTTSPKPKDLVA